VSGLAFLALGFGRIKIEPGSHRLLWLGSYFGFTAVCMLALALYLHGRAPFRAGPREALPDWEPKAQILMPRKF
jgi:hypothetical protein